MAIDIKRILKSAALLTCALLFLWLFFNYLLNWTSPFIIAFAVSRIIETPVSYLEEKLNIPRRLSSFICVALFYILLGFLAKEILSGSLSQIRSFLLSLPDAQHITENLITVLKTLCTSVFGDISPKLISLAQRLISNGISLPIELRDKFMSFTSSAAALVPNVFLFLITAVLSSYFFSSDYGKIRTFMLKNLPKQFIDLLNNVRINVFSTLLRYIKALGVLALITWAELCAGFIFLKVENAVQLALFIAVLDALPVLGTGFIIIPWAIAALIQGLYTRAIGLSALYLTVTLIRNLLEPHIIGKQTGLHPLISLASVYIGLRIFGAYGLFMPPLLSLLQQLLRPHKRAAAK